MYNEQKTTISYKTIAIKMHKPPTDLRCIDANDLTVFFCNICGQEVKGAEMDRKSHWPTDEKMSLANSPL